MASKKKKPSKSKSKSKKKGAKAKSRPRRTAKKKPAARPKRKAKPKKKAAGKRAASKKKSVKKKPAKKKPAKKKTAKKKTARKKPAAKKASKKKAEKKPLKKAAKKKSTPIIIPKRKKTHQLSKREQKIYRDLLNRRERLVRELKEKLAMDLHDDSLLDEGDLATRDIASDFLMAVATIEGEEIKNIDDALRAIKEGTYGKCAACSGRIQAERLKALPSVKLCIKCKELEEQGKLF